MSGSYVSDLNIKYKDSNYTILQPEADKLN